MIIRSIFKCAIVLTLTHCHIAQCDSDTRHNRTPTRRSWTTSSSISNRGREITSGENVTRSDNDGSFGKRRFDNRESPSSARHRQLDTTYLDYDESGISAASATELPNCILSRSEFYLSWWVDENGQLKLPASNRDGKSPGFADLSLKFSNQDAMFKHISYMTSENPSDVIIFMSIANNGLATLPYDTLDMVSVSLQYLSLANNNFNSLFADHNKTFQSWSAFPLMNSLKELDLRNCSLTNLDDDIFKNLPNLEKLFLSHNSLSEISAKTFSNLSHLSHLDLSYNSKMEITAYNRDPFNFYLNGLLLNEAVFTSLTNLLFLDLSHTKLRQESVRALSALGRKLEQLSLCYTDIPLIAPKMFNGTNMKVLDLSGNPALLPSLSATWFEGLEGKMEILIFQNSNIKSIAPLRYLRKLRMLDLGNNNINQISPSNFANFGDLEILDLNTNHISNWYERVFRTNDRLKIINLRNNNINLMTPEMMNDFGRIKFLAIGANNFVCDCSLREFIDRATYNALVYQCASSNSTKRTKRYITDELLSPKYHYDVFLREFHNYVRFFDASYKNIIGQPKSGYQTEMRAFLEPIEAAAPNCDIDSYNMMMTFEFLLLDYNENDYHCIESNGSTKKKVLFSEIDPCLDRIIRSTDGSTSIFSTEGNGQDFEEDNNRYNDPAIEWKTSKVLLTIASLGVPLSLLAAVWFWKKRDIRYFCAILKNSLILSLDKDDKKALVMKNRRKRSNAKDDYNYDVFVSYSDKDRPWVLDQLIPNLEKRSEITICLHERDFQVGVGILENIIHSMDQSRCLLLVISESFLKSNWCSFEMHLAQHRLIETRREQLILVLLQDIPKSRRPRTLTFLMRTKTYIMWPSEDKEELRNVFWKRLKKAITLNNWEPERTTPKPRHSIV